jgi:hypothetical protein
MAHRPTLRAVPELPDAARSLSPQEAAPADLGLAALGEEVADLRDALFAAGDLARRAVPYDQAGIHVALQAAAHQLGVAQRLLSQTA